MHATTAPNRLRFAHTRVARGFTLIELMIVVVIMSILAAVAFSSYRGQVTKTRRTDATVAINELANRLEKFYGTCLTYTADLTAAMPGPCAGTGLNYRTTSPDGHYALRVTDLDPGDGFVEDIARGYEIRATPVAGGLQANDGFFILNSLGVRQFDTNKNGVMDASENKWP